MNAQGITTHSEAVEKVYDLNVGVIYYVEGWMCPALYKYFETVPGHLSTMAEPIPGAAAQ